MSSVVDRVGAASAEAQYEVIIAKYGTRHGRRSEVYLNYALYGDADSAIAMDYFVWIVRSAEKTVVVDTGFSPRGGGRRQRTTLMPPGDFFKHLNIDVSDVRDVVITHAHYDHIGNLDLFPNATFTIAHQEYEFWTSKYAKKEQFHHSVEDDELMSLSRLNADGRLRFFEDTEVLAPGIKVVRIGGHTPGQSMVLVDTSEGRVLLASDAVHYYEELEREMPFMSVANLIDMYEGFHIIKDWVDVGFVRHVVAGHDPDTLNRFARSAQADLRDLVSTIGVFE